MKCLQLNAGDHKIITEDLSVYLIIPYRTGKTISDDAHSQKYPEEVIGYKLEKLSDRARIDFKTYYGNGIDNSKANWTCDHFPVVESKGELIWDY